VSGRRVPSVFCGKSRWLELEQVLGRDCSLRVPAGPSGGVGCLEQGGVGGAAGLGAPAAPLKTFGWAGFAPARVPPRVASSVSTGQCASPNSKEDFSFAAWLGLHESVAVVPRRRQGAPAGDRSGPRRSRRWAGGAAAGCPFEGRLRTVAARSYRRGHGCSIAVACSVCRRTSRLSGPHPSLCSGRGHLARAVRRLGDLDHHNEAATGV
jgi:hypothetical protein